MDNLVDFGPEYHFNLVTRYVGRQIKVYNDYRPNFHHNKIQLKIQYHKLIYEILILSDNILQRFLINLVK